MEGLQRVFRDVAVPAAVAEVGEPLQPVGVLLGVEDHDAPQQRHGTPVQVRMHRAHEAADGGQNSLAQITGWSRPNPQTQGRRQLERVMRIVNGAVTWS